MLRIKKIEIEGFRGFTKKNTVEFNSPVILLFGGNHQGKSSVLNAIEWCLYGDKCLGEKSRIRERVGTGESAWRVVNDNDDMAVVKLTIEFREDIFTVTRKEIKGRGKKGKSIKIDPSNGTPKEGDDAEKEISKLLQVSYRDFATTIYQHQETIHDFVIQKTSERSDAMDRLLGLSDYRNILNGIKKSDLSKIVSELAEEFNKLQNRIQETIKTRQEDISDKRDKALIKGMRNEELNEKKLLELAKSIIEDIGNFARQLGLTTPAVSPLSNWKDTGVFITNIKNECKQLRGKSPQLKEQSEKQAKRGKADSLKSQYERQYKELKSNQKKLKEFEQQNGNKDKIDSEIKKTVKEINDVDKEIKRISPKAKLVKEGISILESVVTSDTDICPLCGESKQNLLEHIRKEWREKIESKVDDLENRKGKLDTKKNDMEKLSTRHDRLSEDFQEEEKRLNKINVAISRFLNKEISNKDDPVAILSIEIKKIDNRFKEIEDDVRSMLNKIDAITEKTDTMNLLFEILLLNEKLEKINKIKETNEYRKQEKIKDDVSILYGEYGKIEELSEIIKKCMKKEAEEKISSASNSINTYFCKITQNPTFQMLNIKVDENKKTGVNSYTFEDENGKEPVPVLSQGDLNSLAMSIFLGLAKTARDSHPLGFILMDDPSQSLDSEQKARLIELIDDISEMKNIVVSTMDKEFKRLLKDNITKTKTVYLFSDWMPVSGVKISKEI